MKKRRLKLMRRQVDVVSYTNLVQQLLLLFPSANQIRQETDLDLDKRLEFTTGESCLHTLIDLAISYCCFGAKSI